MLHKGSLLQQTNKHLSNCLLHPSNSHNCYRPLPQAQMLPQCSSVSCNLYSQQLAHKANLAGNQGNLHHLGKHSTRLSSLSFQQQGHSKIMLYPTHRSQKVPKSADGKGVKNGGPDGHLHFHCGQLGHLKKDCPLGPYCSCCNTKGHIPANCPNNKRQQQNEMHGSGNQQPEERCENWKRAQDQPQYSNPENKCLHYAGNYRSCDCPTRHQHQAPPATNPVGGTGTHSPHYLSQFSNPSPQQHSQQSQSTVGSSTPTLMVNNNLWSQQGTQRQMTPPAQNQVNHRVRPSQPVNPQYNQFNIQQQSPNFAPQQFSAQYPPPYPGQWLQQPPSVHSNTTETSLVLTLVLDRHFKLYEDRENTHEQHKREKEK